MHPEKLIAVNDQSIAGVFEQRQRVNKIDAGADVLRGLSQVVLLQLERNSEYVERKQAMS